jgi:hypothetical protein
MKLGYVTVPQALFCEESLIDSCVALGLFMIMSIIQKHFQRHFFNTKIFISIAGFGVIIRRINFKM